MLDTLTRPSPPILFERTQGVLSGLEAALGQPVITYWNSASGGIHANDVVALYGVLRRMGPRPRAALFIKSDGGSGEASLRMVNVLRQYHDGPDCAGAAGMRQCRHHAGAGRQPHPDGPAGAICPRWTPPSPTTSPPSTATTTACASARTSCTALCACGRLEAPPAPMARAPTPIEKLFEHVHPLVIGAVDRASALSTRICAEILGTHLNGRRPACAAISDTLNASNTPATPTPSPCARPQRIGLPA